MTIHACKLRCVKCERELLSSTKWINEARWLELKAIFEGIHEGCEGKAS
jgi:hypothetical protein